MSNNIRVLFFCKFYRKNINGDLPLMLRVTYSKNVKQLSTVFFLNLDRWDDKQKLVRGNRVL